MDFICYGSARELIIYILTIAVAFAAMIGTRRAIDWYIVNIRNQKIPAYTDVRKSSAITFTVFCLVLFTGIYASHTAMTELCGFAPDPEGAHRDRSVIELQRQIEDNQARINLLRSE